jgi:hypothetical protein
LIGAVFHMVTSHSYQSVSKFLLHKHLPQTDQR